MSWNGMRTRPSLWPSSKSSDSSVIWGSIFPEEYGGAGLGYVEYSIIIEELSRVDGSVGIIVARAHIALFEPYL